MLLQDKFLLSAAKGRQVGDAQQIQVANRFAKWFSKYLQDNAETSKQRVDSEEHMMTPKFVNDVLHDPEQLSMAAGIINELHKTGTPEKFQTSEVPASRLKGFDTAPLVKAMQTSLAEVVRKQSETKNAQQAKSANLHLPEVQLSKLKRYNSLIEKAIQESVADVIHHHSEGIQSQASTAEIAKKEQYRPLSEMLAENFAKEKHDENSKQSSASITRDPQPVTVPRVTLSELQALDMTPFIKAIQEALSEVMQQHAEGTAEGAEREQDVPNSAVLATSVRKVEHGQNSKWGSASITGNPQHSTMPKVTLSELIALDMTPFMKAVQEALVEVMQQHAKNTAEVVHKDRGVLDYMALAERRTNLKQSQSSKEGLTSSTKDESKDESKEKYQRFAKWLSFMKSNTGPREKHDRAHGFQNITNLQSAVTSFARYFVKHPYLVEQVANIGRREFAKNPIGFMQGMQSIQGIQGLARTLPEMQGMHSQQGIQELAQTLQGIPGIQDEMAPGMHVLASLARRHPGLASLSSLDIPGMIRASGDVSTSGSAAGGPNAAGGASMTAADTLEIAPVSEHRTKDK